MIEETKRILEDVMERQARAATATLAARGSSDAPRRHGTDDLVTDTDIPLSRGCDRSS